MLATLGHVIPVDEQLARWEQVTHADVRRVIDRVYGAGRPVTVSVGPAYDRSNARTGLADRLDRAPDRGRTDR